MDRRRQPRATGGPPVDLVRFLEQQYPRVYGTLALYVGDAGLADDLTQEAFVRLCQRWERVAAMDAPGPWIHRVAMNLAHSAMRRRGAEGRAMARVAATPTAGNERLGDGVAGALDVRRAVAALPEPERAVIVLRFFADLSVADTATALGIPAGTVKTRTRRAVERLCAGGIEPEVSIDD
jgi:RNA polymerase sigma-70 factor (ECF subfamily)